MSVNQYKYFDMASIYQKFALFAVGTALNLVFSNTTKVAAITYNEAINGDLPTFFRDSNGNLPPFFRDSNVFGLDLGTNTFTGEITFSNSGLPLQQTDFDYFRFSVPNETHLESVLFNISLLSGGSGIFNIAEYELGTLTSINNYEFLDSELVTIPSTNISLFTSDLPLESGLFSLATSLIGGALEIGEFQTAAYTFSLTVAPAACR